MLLLSISSTAPCLQAQEKISPNAKSFVSVLLEQKTTNEVSSTQKNQIKKSTTNTVEAHSLSATGSEKQGTTTDFTPIDIIKFGRVVCNTSSSGIYTINIYDPFNPTKSVPGTVDSIWISGPNANEFRVEDISAASRTLILPAAVPLTFSLVFVPTSLGFKNATFNYKARSSSGIQIKQLPIEAEKQLLNFSLLAANYTFPSMQPFTATTATIPFIVNTGTIPLDWTLPSKKVNGVSITNLSPNPTPVGGVSTITIAFDGGPPGTIAFFDQPFINRTCNINTPFAVTVPVRPNPQNITVQSQTSVPISTSQYGNFLCEAAPKDITVQLFNSGQLDLTVTGATITPAGDFQIISPPNISSASPLTVPYYSSTPVTIRYNPRTLGTQNVALRFFSNASNTPTGSTTLTLTAVKDSASLLVPTALVQFPTVDQGDVAQQQQFSFTNNGTVPRSWSLPIVVGNFTVDNITPNPTPAGQQAQVTVRFTNTTLPGAFSNTLNLTDSCGRIYPVVFRETVQQPKPGIEIVNPLIVPKLTCADTASIAVPITNRTKTSGAPLIISNVMISGTDAADFILQPTTYPFQIGANTTDTRIRLLFRPRAGTTGRKTAQLTIVSDGQNVTQDGGRYTIILEAFKDIVGFTLSRRDISLTNLLPNTDYSDTLTLTNTGTVDLTWGAPPNNVFAIANPFFMDVTPQTTPVGKTSLVTIRFRTTQDDVSGRGTFVDICGKQDAVNITASMLRPRIATDRGFAAFGILTCEPNLATTIKVTNTGGQDLRLTSPPTIAPNAGFTVVSPNISAVTPLVIRRGDSTEFRLNFVPPAGRTGDIQAIMSIGSNAINGTTTVTLQARKDSLGFDLSVSSVVFNNLPPNTPSTATFTIRNTGNLKILWGTTPFTFGNGDDRRFRIDAIMPPETPVGGTSTVQVTFLGAPNSKAGGGQFIQLYSADTTLRTNVNTLCDKSANFRMAASVLDALATLEAGRDSASPGTDVIIPIYLRNGRYLQESKATEFTVNLRYNYSLIYPLENAPFTAAKGRIQGRERTISLRLPVKTTDVSGKDTVLARLKFRTTLGSTTGTVLHLDSLVAVGGIVKLDTIPGQFNLIGLCYEGGTRLFDDGNATLSLAQNAPNPSADKTTISFSILEPGKTSLTIFNIMGKEVLRAIDAELPVGGYDAEIDVSQLSSGIYFYVLQTPTARLTKRMEVVK